MVQQQFDSKPLDGADHSISESSQVLPTATNTDSVVNPSSNRLTTPDDNLSQNGQMQLVTNESSSHWSGRTGQGKQWHIYLGDAKTVLSYLPENVFQCVITSPPYYWLRDYGVEGQIGKEWTVSEYVQAQ